VLATIFLLLLGGLIALLWRRQRLAASLLLVDLIVVYLGGTQLFPSMLLNELQVGYPTTITQWGKKPAIVLLGMGTEQVGDSDTYEVGGLSQARLLKALELYHDCEKGPDECRLIISGGDPQAHGRSEAEVYAERLLDLGVEPDDVIQEPLSRNTWENAKNTSAIVKNQAFDQVVVVSSGVHVRRAAQYFAHFGISVVPVRADFVNPKSGLIPDATNLWLTTVALHEYVGMARFHVYNVLGWNG